MAERSGGFAPALGSPSATHLLSPGRRIGCLVAGSSQIVATVGNEFTISDLSVWVVICVEVKEPKGYNEVGEQRTREGQENAKHKAPAFQG